MTTDSNESPQEPAAPARDPLSKIRHDLRTPINQIIGYSELLTEEATDEGLDSFAQDLRKITTAAQRMLKLLEDAFANPDAVRAMSASADRGAAGPAASAATIAPPFIDSVPEEASGVLAEEDRARLLIADDDELNRDMLARRLRAHGYEVEAAEDGVETLEMIEASAFDLLLLDVMMPRMNGIEALKAVRTSRGLADLPVIMATGVDESGTIVEALRLGANDYVTKPLDFPVVLARVKTQLSLKRAKDAVEKLAESLEIRNRFIRTTFGRYLSDEIVASLLETPEGLRLGGEKRVVTIMMSDLRGFTSLSEHLGPEQVVRMLNNYLGAMASIIQRYQGTIDEFIGDAILAIFGAPIAREDDAARAIACASEMQLAMEAVNAFNRSEGLPELEMGIALNTGEIVVGNIGSEARAKYGVVGSHVNLTSRIESYTVGGQILISEATRVAAGPDVVTGQMIEVTAKGVAGLVTAWDLRGIGGRFNVMLPERIESFVTLAEPLPLFFWSIEGKSIAAESHPARLVRISARAGAMETTEALKPTTNIRLRFDVQGLGDDMYGKVLRAEQGGLVFQFTSVPQSIAPILKKLAAGERMESLLGDDRPKTEDRRKANV